jgi:hydrogenase maturation protease
MTRPRVLVAGIGNIFLGDDAFGCEVARRLAEHTLPDGVRVGDFGIRGLDLAYALLDGYDGAILIDATQRGRAPGTLYVIEPEPIEPEVTAPGEPAVETHAMHPAKVLRLVQALGGQCPWLRVVGCEPATCGSEEGPVMGLSEPVQAAVPEAIVLVQALIQEALDRKVSPAAG